MKKKLAISFSGGRTSAYMLWFLFNEWEERDEWEKIVTFANTGAEAEETLFFVDECSQEWNIPIVWLETKRTDDNGKKLSKKGWAVTHKIVSYETASRKGQPFEEMIEAVGMPRQQEPHCTMQLKILPMESYFKSIGWHDRHTAVGIRFDELHRISPKRKEKKLIYPLAEIKPMTKSMVSEWWQKQSFDLQTHPDEGNCVNCWKKDFPRLARNMIRNPKSFEWWHEMETKYSHINLRNIDLKPPFNFYRGNKSTLDIKKMAEMSQAELKQLTMFDPIDGCGESCEVF